MKEAIFNIIILLFGLLGILLEIAIVVFILALPLIIIYAIYRAVKELMTHNANLNRQRDNDEWRKG